MDTLFPTPLAGSGRVVDAAYDPAREYLATVSEEGIISVWHRPYREEEWSLVSQWQPERGQSDLGSKLAWSHPAFGRLLAVSTGNGAVEIWEKRASPSESSSPPTPSRAEFRRQDTIDGDRAPTCLSFAPLSLGLRLAIANASGLRLFSHSGSDPDHWALENDLELPSGAGCTSFAWRPFSKGVPDMLLVGTTRGASIWSHKARLMRWTEVCELPVHGPVSSVAWAEPSGRPQELLAVACGRTVHVIGLSGPADELKVAIVAKLENPGEVLDVKWNAAGECLAAATARAEILVWRADLVGDWKIVDSVLGVPESDMS